MSKHSVTHATFTIERVYHAAPARVFKAWADPEIKTRWFRGPDEWPRGKYELDFRVGGRERLAGGPAGGTVHFYSAVYQDIVPNERIIIAYDMHLDDRRISVSLMTVELKPDGKGTRLTFTEQGAFLDGWEEIGGRERGSVGLLDKLGRELEHQEREINA
jgi:uncharacterized protein YndB with AHSA1/START domain